MPHDPPRLDQDPELGGLIDALREDAPPPETDARVLEVLRAAASPEPGGAPPTGTGAGTFAAVGSALVLGGAVLAALFWWSSATPDSTPDASPAPAAPVEAAPTPSAPAHQASPEVEPEPVEAEAPPPPARRPRRTARSAAPTETALLLRARRALPGDPAAADRALAEHTRRYPRGILRQEREALRVDLLLARGRTDAARAALDRFEQRFPGSAHGERLRRVVDGRALGPR